MQLTATMSRRELIEWRAWYGVEPRGEDRADWLTGWLAMMLAAVNTPRRSRGRLAWSEFVPRFRPKAPAEPVKLSDQVRAIFGRFKRKEIAGGASPGASSPAGRSAPVTKEDKQ